MSVKECLFNAKLNHRMAILYKGKSAKLYLHYSDKRRYWLIQARQRR